MNLFWFRRDLRLDDNTGLHHALRDGAPVLCIFIFDTGILNDLDDKADRRVEFIHAYVTAIDQQLRSYGSSLFTAHGKPITVFRQLCDAYPIGKVFTNHDYEPYALQRDQEVEEFLKSKNISFLHFKDQVIFEGNEVVKEDSLPYTIFTPYSRKWKSLLNSSHLRDHPVLEYASRFFKSEPFSIPSLEEIGFQKTDLVIPDPEVSPQFLRSYAETRDTPSVQGTSRLSVHLRFGTISIRKLVAIAQAYGEKYLNELIWREFYSMILQHFPRIITTSFHTEYDRIQWRNNEIEFEQWCKGETGFPIVDAGMRSLNATGFMHNRLRMITASFLTKDLLIDWRWGEAYFASKLLDYELASNNGGWQWAASTGCDAVPYFRIFNPDAQEKKFDPERTYIRKWIPEIDSGNYPAPIVDHSEARKRAIVAYRQALNH